MTRQGEILADRYSLLEQTAHGGMATVWRARDEVLARTVAVKILHPHLAGDEDFLQRLRAEALAAARLSHPHIVAIYDTGTHETGTVPTHFIVMEYCGGGTLADLLAARGPLPAPRVAAAGDAICDALSYAHGNGVVHRDIKPANILLTDEGTLKVGDFGIAKAAQDAGDLTTTGRVLGTVAYLSPEQADGAPPDARSDLYSLGVVLYELLCGRPPFEGGSQLAIAMKHLREQPRALRSLNPDVPASVEEVVLKALAKDPADRYASADEMRAALSASVAPDRTTVMPAARPSRRARVARRPAATPGPARSLFPVVALIAAAVIAAIVIAGLERRPEGSGRGGDESGGGGGPLEVVAASDFDPHGDGQEHPDDVDNATDGDESTTWTTETYSSALELQKPGVGLLFDLGEPVAVREVEVVAGEPGFSFELRAANGAGPDEEAFDVVADVRQANARQRLDVSTEASHWLLWITELSSGAGGRAEVAEVRFHG